MVYICPSRRRPGNVVRLIRAWEQTRTSAKLLVAVDEDDPELENYFLAIAGIHCDWFTLAVGPRLRFGKTLNRYALNLLNGVTTGIMNAHRDWDTPPTIIGALGDDHVPRTTGFDQRIKDALDAMGGTGVVYGNDLIQGANLPTAVAMSADIVSALGYMSPPDLTHLFVDNAFKDMGTCMERLQYLPDVILEHIHPVGGKTEWDPGYVEVNSGAMWSKDEAAYKEWVEEGTYRAVLRKLVGI